MSEKMLYDNVDMVIGSTENLKTDKGTHIMPGDALGLEAIHPEEGDLTLFRYTGDEFRYVGVVRWVYQDLRTPRSLDVLELNGDVQQAKEETD